MADNRFTADHAEMERFAGRCDIALESTIDYVKKAYYLGARNTLDILRHMERGNTEEHFISRLNKAWETDTGDVTEEVLQSER